VLKEASHRHAVRQTGRWRCCWGCVDVASRAAKESSKEASHPHTVRRAWSLGMLLGICEEQAALLVAATHTPIPGVTLLLVLLTRVGISVFGR
jgi:hypothetical protein